jgi:hypothetical protein
MAYCRVRLLATCFRTHQLNCLVTFVGTSARIVSTNIYYSHTMSTTLYGTETIVTVSTAAAVDEIPFDIVDESTIEGTVVAAAVVATDIVAVVATVVVVVVAVVVAVAVAAVVAAIVAVAIVAVVVVVVVAAVVVAVVAVVVAVGSFVFVNVDGVVPTKMN